jgi:restriction system protein
MSRIFYEIKIWHDGLNKFRHIRGTDRQIVEQKAQAQRKAWDDMWRNKLKAEELRSERAKAVWTKENKKSLAIRQTNDAQKALSDTDNTLLIVVNKDCKVDWDKIKDSSKFNKPQPVEPKLIEIAVEPLETDYKYQPKLTILDKIFKNLKQKKIDKSLAWFKEEHEEWVTLKETTLNEFKNKMEEYEINLKKWKSDRDIFYDLQTVNNDAIDKQKQSYFNKDQDAIIDYCDMVLSNSSYPDSFPHEFEIDYRADTKIMIIEYLLPNLDNIPKLK